MSPAENVVAQQSSVPPIVLPSSKHSATHSILGVLLVVFLSLNLRPLLTSVAPL